MGRLGKKKPPPTPLAPPPAPLSLVEDAQRIKNEAIAAIEKNVPALDPFTIVRVLEKHVLRARDEIELSNANVGYLTTPSRASGANKPGARELALGLETPRKETPGQGASANRSLQSSVLNRSGSTANDDDSKLQLKNKMREILLEIVSQSEYRMCAGSKQYSRNVKRAMAEHAVQILTEIELLDLINPLSDPMPMWKVVADDFTEN